MLVHRRLSTSLNTYTGLETEAAIRHFDAVILGIRDGILIKRRTTMMTNDPKKDQTRRCMPVAEWPTRDRQAWAAALASGDLLDGSGPAAHWREATRKKTASSYGRFLTFLNRQGLLDPSVGPIDRVTRDILKAYIDELRAQLSSVTLAQRITELHEALRVMAPDADIGFIGRAARRRWAAAGPTRNKQAKVVPPMSLMHLGMKLMAAAETGTHRRRESQACRFRDGLMIAILACRAIRRSNLTSIRISQHLDRTRSGYALRFEGHETKNHRPIAFSLPDMLTAAIDRYIDAYRPILLKGNATDRLWISFFGRPMAHGAVYDRIREITERELGHAIHLHLFRDCQATFQAIEDPEHVGITPLLLGQIDPRTSEQSYNQASTAQAARRYQDDILSLRTELRRSSRRRRKK